MRCRCAPHRPGLQRRDALGLAAGADLVQAAYLRLAHHVVVDIADLDGGLFLQLELVDPDHDLLAAVNARLLAGGRLLDAELGHAGLDRLGHAAQRLDLVDELARLGDQARGQGLHVVAAGQRVDHLGDAGLVLEDELRVARDAGRGHGRERDRLVERVGVQRLRAAHTAAIAS